MVIGCFEDSEKGLQADAVLAKSPLFSGNTKELRRIVENLVEQWGSQMDGWIGRREEEDQFDSRENGMVGLLDQDQEQSQGDDQGMEIDEEESQHSSSNHQSFSFSPTSTRSLDLKPTGTSSSKYAHQTFTYFSPPSNSRSNSSWRSTSPSSHRNRATTTALTGSNSMPLSNNRFLEGSGGDMYRKKSTESGNGSVSGEKGVGGSRWAH